MSNSTNSLNSNYQLQKTILIFGMISMSLIIIFLILIIIYCIIKTLKDKNKLNPKIIIDSPNSPGPSVRTSKSSFVLSYHDSFGSFHFLTHGAISISDEIASTVILFASTVLFTVNHALIVAIITTSKTSIVMKFFVRNRCLFGFVRVFITQVNTQN